MSDSLNFPVFSKVEHSVDTRAHGHASGIVVRCTEIVERRAGIRFHLLRLDLIAFLVCDHDEITVRIIYRDKRLRTGRKHPVHSIAHRRGYIYIFEKCEVREADLEIVGHPVPHIVHCLDS